MDTSLFFLINQGLQNPFLDLIMPFITQRYYILFALLAVPAFMKDRKKGFFVLGLSLISFVLADASSHMLKHIFERQRPCQVLENVRLLVGCSKSFSMPSNHAVNAFAIAATFSHFFRKTAVPMFLIAALVALSRIYVGVHYPSDVIAGAVLGGVIAGTVLILHKWSSERFREKPRTTIFFISLFALTFFRYYYIATGPLDLSPDEAHYWEWSRRLDLSYYSKGPLIAYIIAASTRLMGDTVFAVRFFAPIFLALTSIFIYKLAKELFPDDGDDNKSACAAGLLLQITPLFAAYGILMTIDSPFIFLWTLSLYLFWKATDRNASKKVSFKPVRSTQYSSLTYWLFLGLSVGFGLLTKYTMAFFYICALLFLIFSKEQRWRLKRKELYFAFVLSLLVFGPVIIWNTAHDWVTVKHTAGQAHVAEGLKISFKHFFDFFGSQIGVITPLLFFMVIYGAVKSRVTSYKLQVTSEDKSSSFVTRHSSLFLFWFWAPIIIFFTLKSFQGKVQANWIMPAYITAFIASADFFLRKDMMKKGTRILLIISLIMAFLAASVSHYPEFLNLPVKMDPTSRLKGWKELGIKTKEVYNSMVSSGSKKVFIFSDKYQVSSELAFYMPDKPVTYCVNLGSRMNQYDIWGGFDKLAGFDAIFVRTDNEDFPEELKDAFNSYEKEKFVVERKGKTIRKYFIFKCYGFKGLALQTIKSY